MDLIIGDLPRVRLRARKVDEAELAKLALDMARESGEVEEIVVHGGSVCNKYGYPAETEGAIAIAHPNGRVYVEVIRLPANKVTRAGVVRHILGSFHPLMAKYSGKYSEETWKMSRYHAYRDLSSYVS